MSESVLAMIPARGGSKRVPRKNIKPLGGRPLIAWSIECAVSSGCCSTIAVSTDDPEIAEAAARAGVPVPMLRPPELALDGTESIDVVVHEIQQHRARGVAVDTVVLLQPTSPFRSPATIREGLRLFAASGRRSVVSVSRLTEHPGWCRWIDAAGVLRGVEDAADGVAREGRSAAALTQLNGLLYVADADHVLAMRSLYSDPTMALLIDSKVEAIDIDTPLDWCFAEAVVAAALHLR